MRDSEEKAGKKGEQPERLRCGTGVGEAREGRAWAGGLSYYSTNTYYSTNITYLTIYTTPPTDTTPPYMLLHNILYSTICSTYYIHIPHNVDYASILYTRP